MKTDLLERESQLASLSSMLNEAIEGSGKAVLVSGEAGIGKTALVEQFVTHQQSTVRVLRGGCDPLVISHALCPLHDMARQLTQTRLGEMVWEARQIELFYYFLQIIEAEPTILIFEDIHWADEATLDLLSFMVRRLQQMSCLLIATYRDDEISVTHPLTPVLGLFRGNVVQRIKLQPLTRDTVTRWAEEAGKSVDGIYEATGGNPLYITETLISDLEGIPQSISEIVLARLARLSDDARQLVEVAALIPKEHFELQLLRDIGEFDETLLDEVLHSATMIIDENTVAFRHDLTRLAVVDSLSVLRRTRLHKQILETLIRVSEERGNIPQSLITHHARMSGDGEAVLHYAPLAAAEAHKLGAHRQAAEFYRLALDYRSQLPAAEQAKLFGKLSYEYYLTAEIEESILQRQKALEIWQDQDNLLEEGKALRWLSRLHWFMGNRTEAEDYARQAIDKLEQLPPNKALAMAYSNLSQLSMLQYDRVPAIEQGQKAIALAEQLDDHEVLCHALNNVGTAQWRSRDDYLEGKRNLERSLSLALDHHMEEHAARAYTNLGSSAAECRMYGLAHRYLKDGIRYVSQRDLESWNYYMAGWRVRINIEQGNWAAAEAEISDILKNYQGNAVAIRLPVMLARLQLYVRRGEDDAEDYLDELRQMVQTSGEIQRIAPFAVAEAEYYWFAGDTDRVISAARPAYALALQFKAIHAIGAIGIWLWRAGALEALHPSAPSAYHQQVAGDWAAAAETWREIGCPFEEAMALADGDAAAQKKALAILDELGAQPAADWLRQKMRAQGLSVPRGPLPVTQDNPAGLTQRQMDVLELLVAGLSDSEIAEQLFISPKTAGHHVSAILSKLDVRTRQEAAVMAVQNHWCEN